MSNPFDAYDENPFDEYDQGSASGVFSQIRDLGKQVTPDSIPGIVAGRKAQILDQYKDRALFDVTMPYAADGSADMGERNRLVDELAEARASQNEWKPPQESKISRAQSFSNSLVQSGLEIPGLGDAAYGIMSAIPYTGSPSELRQDMRSAKKVAREDHPMSSAAGDIASFVVPGNAVYQGARATTQAGGRLLPSAVKSALTPKGTGVAARMGRYAPVAGGSASAAALDWGAYNATVEAGNRAADEGREIGLGERAEMFGEGVTDPTAWAAGAAISPIYRAGRAAVTAGKNTAEATKDAGKLQLKAGSFTPTPRAEWADAVMESGKPLNRAYKMVAKRLDLDGVTPAQLHRAIDNHHYAGYSSVEEMLFEVAEAATNGQGGGKIKQLAVALGSVGGDAQQTARKNFTERAAGSPARIREELRRAAGIEGKDFYQYGDELGAARRELPKPKYEEAYGKSVTDEAWSGELVPLFETSPSTRTALDDAYKYARDRGDLAVARELATFREGLSSTNKAKRAGKVSGSESGSSAGNVPGKLSTQALDYVDRMLGDAAEGIRRSSGRTELAAGPARAQARLRQVVDPQTGLNEGRSLSAELRASKDALDFGRKGFAAGTDLETLQREFAQQAGQHGGDYIDPALLMGWMRGAEDAVEKATNPGVVIRQIYGSERQRNKLLDMLPSGEGLSSGNKADLTKRRRVLTGHEKSGQVGRFDRERKMLASENQITGNSQTGQRNEAVAAEGGAQRLANTVADALLDPKQAINKGLRHGINRVTQPAIFNSNVNRELGDIMFTGGRDNLKKIANELAKHQKAKPQARTAAPKEQPQPQKKAAQAGFVDPALLTRHPAIAGAAAGGTLAQDIDGDGEVSFAERMAFAAGGAGASKLPMKAPANVVANGIPTKRLGRGLKDLMAEQQGVTPTNAVSPAPRPAPASPVPQAAQKMPDHTLKNLLVGGGVTAGAVTGLSALNNSGAKDAQEPAANRQAPQPQDLYSIRQEMTNDYAGVLANPASASSDGLQMRKARIARIDQLIQRESANRPRGTAELEQARQNLVDRVVLAINRDQGDQMLKQQYQALDELDALIANNPAMPSSPSLKPVRPQQ